MLLISTTTAHAYDSKTLMVRRSCFIRFVVCRQSGQEPYLEHLQSLKGAVCLQGTLASNTSFIEKKGRQLSDDKISSSVLKVCLC